MVVTAGQQRIQRDGMPVRMMDVGRPGNGPGAAGQVAGAGPAPADPAGGAASAPRRALASQVSEAAPPKAAQPAPTRAVAGPNPCNVAKK